MKIMNKPNGSKILIMMSLMVFIASVSIKTYAASVDQGFNPFDGINFGNTPEDMANSLRIVILLTVLTLAPSILVLMTGFTRIVIVLSFVKNAMGVQQAPPNQVVVGLALFITLFVMMPVITEINDTAYSPYIKGEITQEEAFKNGIEPLRGFMFRQTNINDLDLFLSVSGAVSSEAIPLADIPNTVLIPAFVTSEIKRAFIMGFYIYIPFIVIDMVVASTLMTMGMMMLPPVMIALPFKILLFVMVDGWGLTIRSLITSFK